MKSSTGNKHCLVSKKGTWMKQN